MLSNLNALSLIIIVLVVVAVIVLVIAFVVRASVRKRPAPQDEVQRAYEAGVKQAELQRAYEAGLKGDVSPDGGQGSGSGQA